MCWECSECGGQVERPRPPAVCRECGRPALFVRVDEPGTGSLEGGALRTAWVSLGMERGEPRLDLP
jgi:hypothetical protein